MGHNQTKEVLIFAGLRSVPKGSPAVRQKICELMIELNNNATSAGLIALQQARCKMGYTGNSFRQAQALLQHNHELHKANKQHQTPDPSMGAGHVPGPSTMFPTSPLQTAAGLTKLTLML